MKLCLALVLVLGSAVLAASLKEELKPVPGFDWNFPLLHDNWILSGKSRTRDSDEIVMLTPGGLTGTDAFGAVWNRNPLSHASWELLTTFNVQGLGNNGGEGFAVFFTESILDAGNVFGSQDYFKGLAIVFDTSDNDEMKNNPAISAHYLDGTTSYSQGDDGIAHQLAGCIADFRNRPSSIKAKITYDSLENNLSVYVDLRGKNVFQKCLSTSVILRDAPLYIGISAQTLGVADIHSVESFKLVGADLPAPTQTIPTYSEGIPAIRTESNQVVREQVVVVATKDEEKPVRTSNRVSETNVAPASKVEKRDTIIPVVVDASETLTVEEVLHAKIDALLTVNHEMLSGEHLGAALDEIEDNIIKRIKIVERSFSKISQTVMASAAKGEEFATHLTAVRASVEKIQGDLQILRASDITKISVTIQDLQRLVNDQAINIQMLKNELKNGGGSTGSGVNTDAITSAVLDALKNSKVSNGSGSNVGVWILIGLIQVLFAFVLVMWFKMKNQKPKLL